MSNKNHLTEYEKDGCAFLAAPFIIAFVAYLGFLALFPNVVAEIRGVMTLAVFVLVFLRARKYYREQYPTEKRKRVEYDDHDSW